VDATTFTISPGNISLTSTGHLHECVPDVPPTELFEVAVDAGVLAPGDYSVVWSLAAPLPPLSASEILHVQSRVTVAQSPSGTTVITLTGDRNQCYSLDETVFAATAGQIVLTTAGHGTTCFPESPPEGTYKIDVDVGVLAPGNYTVIWTWAPPLPAFSYTTSFDAGFGATSAIPTLSQWSLIAPILLLPLSPIVFRRHGQLTSSSGESRLRSGRRAP
jgi:hypothetical protein